MNQEQLLRQLLSSGQFKRAERILLRLLKPYPDHAFYQAKLATVYLRLKQIDTAAAVVDSTVIIESAHAADYLGVAEALFESGERDRGLAMATGIARSTETAMSYMTLAWMHDQLDQKDALVSALESALEQNSRHLGARLELARYHIETGSFAVAEGILIKLLTDYPIQARTNSLYAQLLSKTGFPERALSRLDRTLVLWPGSCDIHLERLQLLVDLAHTSRYESVHEELQKHCRDEETLTRAIDLLGSNHEI